MIGKMVTANRLSDGVVVYRTADGRWTHELAEGEIVEGKELGAARLAEAEAAVAACRVVAPYLIDVVAEGEVVRPARFREAIRAAGPTVGSEFRAAAPLEG